MRVLIGAIWVSWSQIRRWLSYVGMADFVDRAEETSEVTLSSAILQSILLHSASFSKI
jgi:hypothetical protein